MKTKKKQKTENTKYCPGCTLLVGLWSTAAMEYSMEFPQKLKNKNIILFFLPAEFHGQRSLEGYNPWGRKELDTTKWLTLSLSLCYSVIPLLGIHSKELKSKSQRDICTPTFIAASFTIAKKCKQPKRPSTDEGIKKNVLLHICVPPHTHLHWNFILP